MKKTSTIIASIALSFAIFFTYVDLNLVLGQNTSSGASAGGNSTSTQNQTSSSLNQTQSGTSDQVGQSQSQSGPVGQSGQSSLSNQIEKQIQTNQANQTGRSEHF
jgi:hypothetical protein